MQILEELLVRVEDEKEEQEAGPVHGVPHVCEVAAKALGPGLEGLDHQKVDDQDQGHPQQHHGYVHADGGGIMARVNVVRWEDTPVGRDLYDHREAHAHPVVVVTQGERESDDARLRVEPVSLLHVIPEGEHGC